MFILNVVKVVCFDTLLQVLILKGVRLHQNCAKCSLPRSPFILKVVKALCFDKLFEVLILRKLLGKDFIADRWRLEKRDGRGEAQMEWGLRNLRKCGR